MDAVEIEIDVAEEEEEAVFQQEIVGTSGGDSFSQLFEADSSASFTQPQEEPVQPTDMVLLHEDQSGQDVQGAAATVMDADGEGTGEEHNQLHPFSLKAPSTLASGGYSEPEKDSATDPDINEQHNPFSSTAPSTLSNGERAEGEWVTPVSIACYYNMNANSDYADYSLAKVKIEPGVELDTPTAGEVTTWQVSGSGEPQNPASFSENFVNPACPVSSSTDPFSSISPCTQMSGVWYKSSGVDRTAFDYNSGSNVLLTDSGSVEMSESEYVSVLHVGNSRTTVDEVSGCSVFPFSTSDGGVDENFSGSCILMNYQQPANSRQDGFGVQSDTGCASQPSHTKARTKGSKDQELDTNTSEDVFACEHPGCGASFPLKKSLKLHVLFGHKPENPQKIPVIEKPPVVFKCMQPGCSAVFHLVSHLDDHRTTHTEGKPHKCFHCHIAFGKARQLKGHKCVPRKQFVCDRCGANVFTEIDLEEHKREVHMKKCIACKESFEDDVALRQHFSLTHTGPRQLPSGRFECPHCGHAFSNAYRLKQHIVVHTDQTLKCSRCPAMFRKKRELKVHLRTHRSVYECKDCGLVFYKAKSLAKHICSHKKLWQCTECDAGFMQEKALNSHMMLKHRESVRVSVEPEMPPEPGSVVRPEPRMKLDHAPVPVACYYNLGAGMQAKFKVEPGMVSKPEQAEDVPLSQLHFSNMQASPFSDKSVLSVISSLENSTSGTANRLVSTASSKVYNPENRMFFSHHLSEGQCGANGVNSISTSVTSEVPNSLLSSVSSDISNDVSYDNPSFDKFDTAQVYETGTHSLSTAASKPKKSRSRQKTPNKSKVKPELVFRCLLSGCSAVFHTVADLNKHRALHGKKHKRCKQCGALFANLLELQMHRCELRCTKCDARFVRRKTLTKHMQAAHETKGFVCAQCLEKFFNAQELQTHVEEKHPQEEKQPQPKHVATTKTYRKMYQCGDCDAVFVHVAYLASHRVVHTGNMCPHCPVSFRTKAEYKRHQINQHKKVLYECEDCGASFAKASTLAKHKIKHQKPFKCTVCPASYLYAKALKSHILFCHSEMGKSKSMISQDKNSEIKSAVEGFHAEPSISVQPVSMVGQAHFLPPSKPDNLQSGQTAESSPPLQLKATSSTSMASTAPSTHLSGRQSGSEQMNHFKITPPSSQMCGAQHEHKGVNPCSTTQPVPRVRGRFCKVERATALQKEKAKADCSDTSPPPHLPLIRVEDTVSSQACGAQHEHKEDNPVSPTQPVPRPRYRGRFCKVGSFSPTQPIPRVNGRFCKVKRADIKKSATALQKEKAKADCSDTSCPPGSTDDGTAEEEERRSSLSKPRSTRLSGRRKRRRRVKCGEADCNSAPQKKSFVREHVAEPLKCSNCHESFKTKAEFDHHRKTVFCPECGIVYSSLQLLKSHMPAHNLKPYKCAQCGNTYSYVTGLQKHVREHHSFSDQRTLKLFQCADCDATFSNRCGVESHRQVHAKDKLCKCSQCCAIFRSERKFKQHNMSSHWTVYSCDKCSARFFKKKTLVNHMLHHRERSFACTDCEATFFTDSALNVHVNKAHLTETEDKILFPSATKFSSGNCVAPELPPEPGSVEPFLQPLLKPESATPVPIACYFNLGSSTQEGVLSDSNLGNSGESGVFPVKLERVGPVILEDDTQIEINTNSAESEIEEMDVS